MTAKDTASVATSAAPGTARGILGLAGPAARTGLVAAAALVAVAVGSGVLPAGSTGYVLAGAVLAALCGLLGCGLIARMARAAPSGDGRLQAMRIQVTLGLTLLIKLLAVAAGVGLLALQGVKFPELAAFAIAFAAVALLFQLASAVTMARVLGRGGQPPVARGAGAERARSGSPRDLTDSASKSSSTPD